MVNGRRLDLGWWTHNAIDRWCIVELYTWNLYDLINQCHPINSITKKETKDKMQGWKEVIIGKGSLLIISIWNWRAGQEEEGWNPKEEVERCPGEILLFSVLAGKHPSFQHLADLQIRQGPFACFIACHASWHVLKLHISKWCSSSRFLHNFRPVL